MAKANTKKINTDLPLSTVKKLHWISEKIGINKTNTLVQIIRDSYDKYRMDQWRAAAATGTEQKEFVDAYIRDRFNGVRTTEHMSEALNAYDKSIGAKFGPDEDSFIFPFPEK